MRKTYLALVLVVAFLATVVLAATQSVWWLIATVLLAPLVKPVAVYYAKAVASRPAKQ